MKTLILIFSFILSLTAFGSEKILQNKVIQGTILETASYLKDTFAKELNQSVGVSEFSLKVNLLVNERQLQKTLGVSEEDWAALEGMQLPGLFVEGKESLALSLLRDARKEDILLSLKAIKVDLHYHEENYSPEFLKKVLLKVISSNTNLSGDQIEVAVFREEAPYRKDDPQIEKAIKDALARPLSVKLEEHSSQFTKFWNNYFHYILAFAGVIILATALLLGLFVKGGLGNIADIIKAKTFFSPDQNASSPYSHEMIEDTSSQLQGKDSFESYIQANNYLTQIISREPKISNEVIVLKLMAEDFISLTVLLDVLSKDKREAFLANIDKTKRERFKRFLVEQGAHTLKDEEVLKKESIKLIKLMKVASLSPEQLYEIVVSDMVEALKIKEMKDLFTLSTVKEKIFMSDLVTSERLALMVQEELIGADELEMEVSRLDQSEMLDLLIKSTQVRGQKSVSVRKEKLEEIYAQIDTEKAEMLADAVGLEPELRFEYLFLSFEKDALKYLQGMEYDRLALLYPLMTAKMQECLLNTLPELLSERLKFAKKKVNQQSLRLKGEFYFYLRSHAQIEDKSRSDLKLVA